MQRTQIYLPKDLHLTLRRRARRRGVTMSQIIRENLDQSFHRRTAGKAQEVFDSLSRFSTSLDWKKTPRDLAQRVDEFAYAHRSSPIDSD